MKIRHLAKGLLILPISLLTVASQAEVTPILLQSDIEKAFVLSNLKAYQNGETMQIEGTCGSSRITIKGVEASYRVTGPDVESIEIQNGRNATLLQTLSDNDRLSLGNWFHSVKCQGNLLKISSNMDNGSSHNPTSYNYTFNKNTGKLISRK